MKDKIRTDYVEAQFEIWCLVCSTVFMAFPDIENDTFACPKCDRTFKFKYSLEVLDAQEIIKKRLKKEAYID